MLESMDFLLTGEQKMIVQTVRTFVEKELAPYEEEVEQTNDVRPDLQRQIIDRAIEQGLYAANMPVELGGGGLDSVTMLLMEIELAQTNYALSHFVYRPSNILQACVGEQRDRYLFPSIKGEKNGLHCHDRTQCWVAT